MRSSRNLETVIERRSFPEFLEALNYHTDIKEWSEVGGVFNRVRDITSVWEPDLVIDAGCGKRPTLAIMMALSYPWPVWAIDPQLSYEYADNINDLHLRSCELCNIEHLNQKSLLLLANHCHASSGEVKGVLDRFDNWVYLTVPCCVNNLLPNQFSIHYKDHHMHSPKNEIYVFASDREVLAKLLSGGNKDV